MPRSKRPKKCLCGKCGGAVHCRGLSKSCYQSALRDVSLEKITWETLVAQGKALPAIPHRHRRRTGIGEVIDDLAAAS